MPPPPALATQCPPPQWTSHRWALSRWAALGAGRRGSTPAPAHGCRGTAAIAPAQVGHEPGRLCQLGLVSVGRGVFGSAEWCGGLAHRRLKRGAGPHKRRAALQTDRSLETAATLSSGTQRPIHGGAWAKRVSLGRLCQLGGVGDAGRGATHSYAHVAHRHRTRCGLAVLPT